MNKKAKLTLEVRKYFSLLGSKGGKAGKPEDKRKAALARWSRARISQVEAKQ